MQGGRWAGVQVVRAKACPGDGQRRGASGVGAERVGRLPGPRREPQVNVRKAARRRPPGKSFGADAEEQRDGKNNPGHRRLPERGFSAEKISDVPEDQGSYF